MKKHTILSALCLVLAPFAALLCAGCGQAAEPQEAQETRSPFAKAFRKTGASTTVPLRPFPARLLADTAGMPDTIWW